MRIDDTLTTTITVALGAALGAVVRHLVILGAAPPVSVAAMQSQAIEALGIIALSYATAIGAWFAGDALRSRRNA